MKEKNNLTETTKAYPSTCSAPRWWASTESRLPSLTQRQMVSGISTCGKRAGSAEVTLVQGLPLTSYQTWCPSPSCTHRLHFPAFFFLNFMHMGILPSYEL